MRKNFWIDSGAIHTLVKARKQGLSLKNIVPIIETEYGKRFTVARLSQVLKSLRDSEALNLKESV